MRSFRKIKSFIFNYHFLLSPSAQNSSSLNPAPAASEASRGRSPRQGAKRQVSIVGYSFVNTRRFAPRCCRSLFAVPHLLNSTHTLSPTNPTPPSGTTSPQPTNSPRSPPIQPPLSGQSIVSNLSPYKNHGPNHPLRTAREETRTAAPPSPYIFCTKGEVRIRDEGERGRGRLTLPSPCSSWKDHPLLACQYI